MTETRTCQMCKMDFVIDDEDFNFYTKVDVPPPTFCPPCRAQRRMSFLNERTFYKRKCDMTGESIVSLFPQDSVVPVYSPKAWWSDAWEATDYGMEYDFSRPFFEQFGELLRKVPQFSLQNQYTTMVRTEYVNMGVDLKDCYLVFNTAYSEESAFTTFLILSKKCLDIYKGRKCELCYECTNVVKCYKTAYTENSQRCVEVYFSKNMRGCEYCFCCSNLVKKSYYIFNKQYSKEEYFEELKKYDLGSYKTVQEMRAKADEFHNSFPQRYYNGIHNMNVSGNQIFYSKNTYESFECDGLEDSKYCQFVYYKPARDCYDMTLWGQNATRIYECMGAGDQEDMVKFSFDCWAPGINIEYSYHIVAPNKNIFGCVGLKNKEYCILNKQYTKEEYEALLPKIKKHMDEMPYVDKRGIVYKYGEFFPSELSLFAYNESFANNYFSLTESEAIEKGFRWKEIEQNSYQITMPADKLPDDIKDVDESIVKEVIECAVSKRAFRLTPAEFQFYKTMGIPLPRLHPDERHKARLAKQNPMQLWHGQCMCEQGRVSMDSTRHDPAGSHGHEGRCPNEFETSYSPERVEVVYCESCYQKEVM